jgi:uncharacterized glyoxalase superfamily protein PhnB
MTKVKAVPEGMHTVTPGLQVDGAAEALEVYKRAFGAHEIDRAIDPSGTKIWHASFRIGDSTVFINDVMPSMGGSAQPARLWLYVEDVDAAFERAAAAGLTATMPPTDMFWGDRMGQLKDKWDNVWTVATRMKILSPEELKRAQDEFVASMKRQG